MKIKKIIQAVIFQNRLFYLTNYISFMKIQLYGKMEKFTQIMGLTGKLDSL